MKKTITSVFLASAALILSACGGNAPTSSPTPSTTSETPIESSSVPVPSTEEKPTTSETPSTTSEEKPVPSESSSSEEEQVAAYAKITLADGATTIEGENHGVTLAGNVVTITKKGTYDIFGTFTNGSIVVASSVKGDVELDLNGCSITRTGGAGTSAPIVNLSSYRMKVKKIKKTTSAIIDNRTGDNGDPAAIYSKGEVGLVGKGTIEITSTYTSGTDVLGFGMASETYAYAKNGVQTITSPGDCINARRSIIVGSPEDGGTFTFTSTSDHGLNVEEETATAAAEGEFIGVKIQQGDYTVVTSNKAIDSQYGLVIEEPATYIDDAGEEQDSDKKTVGVFKSTADNGATIEGDFTMTGGKVDIVSEASSKKGFNFKGKDFTMAGGQLTLTGADDGLCAENATGEITMNGGTLIIEAKKLKLASGKSLIQNGGLAVVLGTKGDLPSVSGTQYSLGYAHSAGLANPGLFKVSNAGKDYYIQPRIATAVKSLYLSTPDMAAGEISIATYTGATLVEENLIAPTVYTVAADLAGETVIGTNTITAEAPHHTFTVA